MRNRAAIEWYFELLLIFAWPVCQILCSFINGNLRRKIGLLKNSLKLQLFADHHEDVWFLFWTGYTGRISGLVSVEIGKLSVNLKHQPFSGIWIRQTSRLSQLSVLSSSSGSSKYMHERES